MGIIKVLPEHIANKIAAGEVVERPSSVVKELIENSIDAGAGSIIIIIRSGGKDLIQVIDDGNGMSEEDARLAFDRHATSKITEWEDLQHVQTFGFRGEALASIASVSDVELKTRIADQDVATIIHFNAGHLGQVTQEAGLQGTSISVKNLFYSVPARRNFLKTNSTEFRHVAGAIKRFAVAYPQIEFTLIHDDEKIFQLKKTDLYGRLEKVIGRDVMAHTLQIDASDFGAKVFGFVSKPSFSFKTRGDQFLYLNARPINNRTANFAVASAYGHTIPKGDKPFFVLFLEWNPEDFDVNVHPTKAEVKFKDEQLLYRVLFHSVRDSMNTDQLIPNLTAALASPSPDDQGNLGFSESPLQAATFSRPGDNVLQLIPGRNREDQGDSAAGFFNSQSEPTGHTHIQQQLKTRPLSNVSSMVWQLHNRYIVSQIKSGLAIIDQHVAHERILYERALEAFEHSPIFSQQLLFPQTIEFSHEEFDVVEKHIDLMEQLGFVMKVFGKRTIVIEAVPADVRLGNEQKILTDIIQEYKLNENQAIDPRDNLAKSFSCKTAIKSGDPLTVEEMNGLIDQLFATKFPYVCPHGRPIIIQLSLDELDKRFMRT